MAPSGRRNGTKRVAHDCLVSVWAEHEMAGVNGHLESSGDVAVTLDKKTT